MSEAGDRRMYGENKEEQEKGHEVSSWHVRDTASSLVWLEG